MTMSHLFLVRHAENRANALEVFSCKRVDYSLTARGILQAQQTQAYLEKRGFDHVYCSPLRRAVETAEIIADRVGLPVHILDDLIEVDVGKMEGQPIETRSRAFYRSVLKDWLVGETETRFPHGEDGAAFYKRVERALERVVSAEGAGRVVVVSHSGFLKAGSKVLYPGSDPDWILHHPYPNCGITEIELLRGEGRSRVNLLSWARHSHLRGLVAQLASN